MRNSAIAKLTRERALEPSWFDRQNLAEIHSLDFPHERLVASFNLELCQKRRCKREDLLASTEKHLARSAAAYNAIGPHPLRPDKLPRA